MSRRPHNKSRKGCLECKKRHIRVRPLRLQSPGLHLLRTDQFLKCDETHPICASCSAAQIRCSFLSKDSPFIVPSHVTAASSPAATTTTSSPATISALPTSAASDTMTINMTHLELFNNLSSREFLSFEGPGQPDTMPTAVYVKYALTTPYLMHQLLAMSALELSIRADKESRIYYYEYAAGLQNRALSLFNESNPVLEVTPTNCIHMFLFSTSVAAHLLCDTLYYQRESLERFTDKFTHCLIVWRGVLAIVGQCRHLLSTTELEPHLNLFEVLKQSTHTSGSECHTLWDLINAVDITESTRKAYQESVVYLQQVFDAQRVAPGNTTRMPLAVAWPILISPDFIDMLRQRKEEALVILAYYAVLLHRGRDIWLIGEGGRFLIESVCRTLDAKWHEWLRFPKATLQDNMFYG